MKVQWPAEKESGLGQDEGYEITAMIELWYLNNAKIDSLYSQTTDRVETEWQQTRANKLTGKGSLTIGKLLGCIGLPLGGEASLEDELARSTTVISSLTAEQKLRIITRWARTKQEITVVLPDRVQASSLPARGLYYVEDSFEYEGSVDGRAGNLAFDNNAIVQLTAQGTALSTVVFFSFAHLVSQTYAVMFEMEHLRRLGVLGFGNVQENHLELNAIAIGAGFCESWGWLCAEPGDPTLHA